MKLTEKEIAKECNVSITTVSRALNNKGRISKKTRDKILAYVEEKQTQIYTQNFCKKTIGLIVPNIQNEYYATMVTTIQEHFSDSQYDILLAITNKDDVKKQNAINDFVHRNVSGIIYIGGITPFCKKQDLKQIPLVCIEHSALIDEPCDCLIHVDHHLGGYLATQKLIEKGCQHILFLGNKGMLEEKEGRFSGYIKALNDAHIPFNEKLVFKSSSHKVGIMEAKNAIHYLLAKGIYFDGVFATSDWRGYGVISALKEHNIAIPSQVQIVGYDDIFISQYSFPSLSTIHIDYIKMARIASQNIQNLIEHKSIASHDILIPYSFHQRESTK